MSKKYSNYQWLDEFDQDHTYNKPRKQQRRSLRPQAQTHDVLLEMTEAGWDDHFDEEKYRRIRKTHKVRRSIETEY